MESPDITGFEYVIDYLSDLGYTDSEGKGISYSEIESWSNLSGVVLTSWEASTLKQLSLDFANQMQKKDINEPTPYKRDS